MCKCEDVPVTYCPLCESFYYTDKNGDKIEICFGEVIEDKEDTNE